MKPTANTSFPTMETSRSTDSIRNPWRLVVVISTACIAYALIRYAYFNGVPIEDSPGYLLNKATSVAGTIFLALAGWHAWKKNPQTVYWGKMAWLAIVLHVVLSFGLFTSAFFPGWFDDGKLNLVGQLVLLTGSIGILGLLDTRLRKWEKAPGEWILVLVSSATLAHVAIMGAKKWFEPASWPGSMPNMSLIAGIAAALALFFYLNAWRRNPKSESLPEGKEWDFNK